MSGVSKEYQKYLEDVDKGLIDPYGRSDEAEESNDFDENGVFQDIAEGVGAGIIDAGEGLLSVATLSIDSVLDTDFTTGLQEGFDAATSYLGLEPTGTAGEVARNITNFTAAFIPVAGWLGRAGQVARGTKLTSPTYSGVFGSAERFGASDLGKRLLNSTSGTVGTYAAGAAISDFAASPDGLETLSDNFDALPDFLETESTEGLSGREKALTVLRNKTRFGIEGAALSSVFDVGIRGVGAASAQVLPPVTNAAVRTMEAAGVMGAMKGLGQGFQDNFPKTDAFFARYFTTAGGRDPGLYETVMDVQAFRDDVFKEGETTLKSFFDTSKKFAKKQAGTLGRNKYDLGEAQTNLMKFLTDPSHQGPEGARVFQEMYGEEALTIATKLRTNVDELTDLAFAQIEKLRANGEINSIEASRLLKEFEQNKGRYLKRIYDQETRGVGVVDDIEALKKTDEYKTSYEEVDAAMRSLGIKNKYIKDGKLDDAAYKGAITNFLNRQLGVGKANRPEKGFALTREEQLALQRAPEKLPKPLDVPFVDYFEDILAARSQILEKSPTLRAMKGELTEGDAVVRRYLESLEDLAKLGSGLKFYREVADNPYLTKTISDLRDADGNLDFSGGAPLVIRPDVIDAPTDETLKIIADIPGAPNIRLFTDEEEILLREQGYVKLGTTDADIDFKKFDTKVEEAVQSESRKNALEGKRLFESGYGPLSGAYVRKEVVPTLVESVQSRTPLGELWSVALQAKGISQISKTVLSPLAQIRNYLSGNFFAIANGHVPTTGGIVDAYALTLGSASRMGDEQFLDFYRLMGKLGLRDQNIVVNEYQALLREGAGNRPMDTVASKFVRDAAEKVQRVPIAGSLLVNAPKSVYKTAETLYAGSDNSWKALSFLAENARLTSSFERAGIKLRNADGTLAMPKELQENLIASGLARRNEGFDTDFFETMVGDIVKQTMPMYSRVPQAIKNLRKIPVAGNFMAFPAEIIRNSANIVNKAVKEMSFELTDDAARAIREAGGDPDEFVKQIRAIGAKRASGYVSSAFVIPHAAQLSAMRALGMEQEDLEALQENTADYMRGHVIIPISNAKDGKSEYIDFSYMAPYDFALAPARAALEVYSRDSKIGKGQASAITSATFEALNKLFEPFAGEALLAERLIDTSPVFGRGGRTATGLRLYEESDDLGEKLQKSFYHVLGGLSPSGLDMVVQPKARGLESGRLVRAFTGEPDIGQRITTPQEEFFSMMSGFRKQEANTKRNLEFDGQGYKRLSGRQKANFNSVFKRANTTLEQGLDAFDDAQQDIFRTQQQLYAKVKAARRRGVSDTDIRRILTQSGDLGRLETNRIMKGEFHPYRPGRSLISDFNKSKKEGPRVNTVLPMKEFNKRANKLRGMSLDAPFDSSGFYDKMSKRTPESILNPPLTPPEAPIAAPQPTATVPQAPLQIPQIAPQADLDPSLLGSNPIEQARNAELARRLGRA